MIEGNRSMPDPVNGFKDQDIRDFDERVQAVLGNDDPTEYTSEPKINGVSVELVYKNGALTIAFTRDHSQGGEYITANLKTLLTVPLSLDQIDENCSIPALLDVRGMVYMEFEAFQALNLHRMEKALFPFKSPADAVADSIRQPNPRITAKRKLNMFCSGIAKYDGPPFETEMESMIMLQKWGLRVNKPHLRLCPTAEKVIQYCHHLKEIRTQFPFKVDGALIKINRLSQQKKLLYGKRLPGCEIVYNFK